MKKVIFTFGILFAIAFASVANAATSGIISISSNKSEAKLEINETPGNGELSKLFDQMKIAPTTIGNHQTKSFKMSNKRFSFVCHKSFGSRSATSCLFKITSGRNTDDFFSQITKPNGRKLAVIGMTEDYSHELAGIFPANARGLTSYSLKTKEGIRFKAQGTSSDNFVIGFTGL